MVIASTTPMSAVRCRPSASAPVRRFPTVRPSRQRDQSALDQIIARWKTDRGRIVLSEACAGTLSRRRHERSPQNNRTSFGAIWASGRMAEQIPALAAAPGIPHTTLVASSWAITLPPAATISLPPRMPSEPMPARPRPECRLANTSIAEENRGSTAGLQKLTRAVRRRERSRHRCRGERPAYGGRPGRDRSYRA